MWNPAFTPFTNLFEKVPDRASAEESAKRLGFFDRRSGK
jgi:hypothetical protein